MAAFTMTNNNTSSVSLHPYGSSVAAAGTIQLELGVDHPLLVMVAKYSNLTLTAGAFPTDTDIINAAKSFNFGDPTERPDGASAVAGGTIPSRSLIQITSGGLFTAAGLNALNVVGASLSSSTVSATGTFNLAKGYVNIISSSPLLAGASIKASLAGTVTRHLNADLVSTSLVAAGWAGGNFGNQPANDSITLVSSSASDVQVATIIGTTNGGVTVVTEAITLTGVTPVVSVKADWGVILAIKLATAAVGTVTATETSGGLTITTLAPAATQAGVATIAAGSQYVFDQIPYIVAAASSTKTMGVHIVAASNETTESNVAAALNNTTPVSMTTAAWKVTEVYVGDVASASTVYVKTPATAEDAERNLGFAFETVTAAGSICKVFLA